MLIWDEIMPSNSMVVILFLASLIPLLFNPRISLGIGKLNSIFFLVLFLLVVLFIHYNSDRNLSNALFTVNFLNLLFSLQLIWIFPFLFMNFRTSILKAIDYSIFLLAFIFLLQYFIYYATGSYLDVLHIFGGRESKFEAYSGLNLSYTNLIRPTSIFNEPGTYCSYSFLLLMLSYFNHKRVKLVHVIVLITYLLSLSAFGLLIALLSSLLFFIREILRRRREGKSILLYGFTLTPFIYGLVIFFKNYFVQRFVAGNNQGGAELRFDTMDIYSSQSFYDRMFGLTFGFNRLETFQIQDASLFFSIFFYFGIFAMPIIFILFKHFRFNFVILITFIIVGLTKINFTSYSLWLFIIAAPLLYVQTTQQRQYQY